MCMGRIRLQTTIVYRCVDIILSTLIDQRTIIVNNIRGGKTMYSMRQTTLSNIQMQFGSSTHKWMGLFTPLDGLIGVNAYIGEEAL
mgnify:CR=1 FL=1